MCQKLLYLHGFNSSPLSLKAQQMQHYMQQYWPDIGYYCPQLPHHPNGAIEQLTQLIEAQPDAQWYLMGSSLGGYFATYLAEQYRLPAVLINPAVKPYQLLMDYLGPHINPYTQQPFVVEQSFIAQLKALERTRLIDQKNYFVMVQTGDEVLDYQQAVAKYAHARLELQSGGNHSFEHFELMLPKVAEFFQWR